MQAQLSQKQKGKQQYWSDVKTGSASGSQAVTWLKEESVSYLLIQFFFHARLSKINLQLGLSLSHFWSDIRGLIQ